MTYQQLLTEYGPFVALVVGPFLLAVLIGLETYCHCCTGRHGVKYEYSLALVYVVLVEWGIVFRRWLPTVPAAFESGLNEYFLSMNNGVPHLGVPFPALPLPERNQ